MTDAQDAIAVLREELALKTGWPEPCRVTQDDARAILAHIDIPRARVAALKGALQEARTWHEAQDKAISKQPNANEGERGWMRCQHQEQMQQIDNALKGRTDD